MWSQIQRKLYDLIDPNLKLQVHCAVYIRAAAGRA